MPSLAAAVGIAAALLVSVAPAQAMPEVPLAPADCNDFEFPGSVQLNISSGDRLTFFASGKDSSGTANWSNAIDFPGTFVGTIGITFVDIDFTDTKGTTHLQGVVGPNGIATGTINELPGVTWTSTTAFKCVGGPAAAANQGPGIAFVPILGGLQVQVTDNSGVASQCTYAADNGLTRTFALGAKATAKINIVPAIPELRDWSVSVSCDNGTRTDTTVFF